MSFFAPRYKKYAAWPVVIWCRVRRHHGQAWWHTPTHFRCIRCGDLRMIRYSARAFTALSTSNHAEPK